MAKQRARTAVILGRGAAGTAAAQELREGGYGGRVLVVDPGVPYNRTLVNKGLLPGLVERDQINLIVPDGVDGSMAAAAGIDLPGGRIQLEDGASWAFDAAIVATGSQPRTLDHRIPGAAAVLASGHIRTLHSAEDALTLRRQIFASGCHDPSVTILGAGLVGSETASILTDAGIPITLVARSPLPLTGALGQRIATTIASRQAAELRTHFGRNVVGVELIAPGIHLHLDDGTRIASDYVVVAHGTRPHSSWATGESRGVEVDDHLRWRTSPRVYAAGGVAVHASHAAGIYQIDHWEDAVAQGRHAAMAALHDLNDGPDPGAYLPAARFSSRVHSLTITGYGRTGGGGLEASLVNQAPDVVAFTTSDGTLAGVVGLEAVPQSRALAGQIGR